MKKFLLLLAVTAIARKVMATGKCDEAMGNEAKHDEALHPIS